MARKYNDKQRVAWLKWYHNLDEDERKAYNRKKYLRRKELAAQKNISGTTELSP